MSNDCAIFYVTDVNFALPTIISAVSVRRQINENSADIRIVFIDTEPDVLARVRRFAADFAITIDELNSRQYLQFESSKFNKTHVPSSSLGRFFMLETSTKKYRRVVYLDGDTLPVGDLKPLIAYEPPRGKIAAAEGLSYFFRNDYGPTGASTRAYFNGIGLDRCNGYFNAGVLAASTETWRELSHNAFDFFVKNIEKCVYHDESALNAVAQDRRVRLSPCWNYQTAYLLWGAPKSVQPALYHFAGGLKPWSGSVRPWQFLNAFYTQQTADLASMRLPIRRLSTKEEHQVNRDHVIYLLKFNVLLFGRKVIRRRELEDIHRRSVI